MVAPTEGYKDEERSSLDARSVHSDFRPGFFTILDNDLTVGESAEGKERAVSAHPHPGGLLEGSVGGCEK
jgi:hypothetical protein